MARCSQSVRARFLQVGRPRLCGELSRDLQRKDVGDSEKGSRARGLGEAALNPGQERPELSGIWGFFASSA